MERQGQESEAPEIVKVEEKIRLVEGRDVHLWSIMIFLSLVVTAGIAAFILPNLVWESGISPKAGKHLPRLLFSLIVLVGIFNMHALLKLRSLLRTREALINSLVQKEAAGNQALWDPLTQMVNRQHLDMVLTKEMNRADRNRKALTLLFVDVQCIKRINEQFGHMEGDRFLIEIGKAMRKVFRKSDTIFRYRGDMFLAVLPETGKGLSHRPAERLLDEVRRWNRENENLGYGMSFEYGFASYETGDDIRDVLKKAEEHLRQGKDGQDKDGQDEDVKMEATG